MFGRQMKEKKKYNIKSKFFVTEQRSKLKKIVFLQQDKEQINFKPKH
jgi:hypothetical protein